jgi:hypothetical protein
MSGVCQNIDLPPPHQSPLTVRRVCVVYPPAFGAGGDTLAGWRGGWGSIFWKTPDTALYSTYASSLCLIHNMTSGVKEAAEANDQ